ncbi:MAG: phosphatidate cytidylyltransferase [Candidatus Omnitrophica bacterium]|nr:phosphatidate cytidylyltransferase [Candidatus Omnitrophota bacterium]
MIDFRQLGKRLSWSAVFIGAAIYAIFWSPAWIFTLFTEVFVILGLLEYFRMAEQKGFFINRYLGLFFGALLPLQRYFPGEAVILTVAVLCLFIFNFHRRMKDNAIVSSALTLFGLVYVAWFFSFLTKIRALDHGPLWVFYLILIVKAGDAAAYFVGKSYGKHKYIVHVSPNKSVEGAVAGFSFTFLLSLLSKTYLTHVPILDLAILGALFGILGQLGDLAESLLKRDAGVKDSGNIPGLGGILDVIDSLLLTIPVAYYYLTTIQGLSW